LSNAAKCGELSEFYLSRLYKTVFFNLFHAATHFATQLT